MAATRGRAAGAVAGNPGRNRWPVAGRANPAGRRAGAGAGSANRQPLPIPLPIRQPASRNGWQIPGSNFGFRF